MRLSIITIVAFLLSGCATTSSTPGVDHTQAVTLVGKKEKELDQNLTYWFISVNGKQTSKTTAGRHLVMTGFRRQGSLWTDNTGLHAKGEVYAEFKEGRRYTITGKYHLGEMRGTYRIVDADSGEPASEEFEVIYVTGRPPPMFIPIFIPK